MPRAHADPAARRLLVASSVGTIIEWYDFFVFASAAALVFDRAFFPRVEPLVGVLLSSMTYAVGFVTRPLGGIVVGILGDRVGRKRALVWSLVLMGLATVAVGVALLERFGSTVPVSIYAAAMAVPGLVALRRARETAGVDLARDE